MALEAILIVEFSYLQLTLDQLDAHLHLLLALTILHCCLPSDIVQALFLPIIMMLAFGRWSLNNKNVCSIKVCINNFRVFALIFCFKRLNSNRCFDSSREEFNVITGNSDNFLTREKSFILDFWLVSECIYAEAYVFRSIYQ